MILIGGPPGAGKSTVGRALGARLRSASLTVDDLLVAARAVTTPESHPAFHLGGGIGHTRYFTDGPKEKLVSDALVQEEAAWRIVERVIQSHVSSGSPVVIDWWLMRPSTVAAMEDDRVRSVWMHIDPDGLWERERWNTDFLAGSPDPEQMLENFMHRSLWRNELVAGEARDHGLPVLGVVGNEPVEALVDKALDLLGVVDTEFG